MPGSGDETAWPCWSGSERGGTGRCPALVGRVPREATAWAGGHAQGLGQIPSFREGVLFLAALAFLGVWGAGGFQAASAAPLPGSASWRWGMCWSTSPGWAGPAGADSWDFRPAFAPVAALLREGDLTVGNLEIPLGGRGLHRGTPPSTLPTPWGKPWPGRGSTCCSRLNLSGPGERRGHCEPWRRWSGWGWPTRAPSPPRRFRAPAGGPKGHLLRLPGPYTYGTNGVPVPPGVRVNRIDPGGRGRPVRPGRVPGLRGGGVPLRAGVPHGAPPLPGGGGGGRPGGGGGPDPGGAPRAPAGGRAPPQAVGLLAGG